MREPAPRTVTSASSWRRTTAYLVIGALANLLAPRLVAAKKSTKYTEPPCLMCAYKDPLLPHLYASLAVLGGVGVFFLVKAAARPRPSSPTLSLWASPARLDFGASPMGHSSQRLITLTNQGVADLVLTRISVSGRCFSLPDPPRVPARLPSGGETQILVAFTPDRPAACTGALEVTSLAPKNGKKVLAVPLGGQAGHAVKGAPAAAILDSKTGASAQVSE